MNEPSDPSDVELDLAAAKLPPRGDVVLDNDQPWMRSDAWKAKRQANQDRTQRMRELGMFMGLDFSVRSEAMRAGAMIQTINNRFELLLRMFLDEDDRLEFELAWQDTLAQSLDKALIQAESPLRKLTIANKLRIKPE